MTGEDHYREAEESAEIARKSELGSVTEAFHLQLAQVHATLALAAFTRALTGEEPGHD